MRPHAESGRHYYFRPSKKQTGAPLALTKETIRRHLEGEITIGLYAIHPFTQRCKWVAIDADYKNALEDLLRLQYLLSQDRVEPALEMSRRGGHLWIFLATPLLAKECRIYIHDWACPLRSQDWRTASRCSPDITRLVTGNLGMPFAARWGFIAGQTGDIGFTASSTRWKHR
jgi:hypothetical protein